MNLTEKRVKRIKLFAFIAFAVAFSCPNYAQYQLSALATRLMQDEMHLTPQQFSSIFTAPMLPALFLSILSGVLVDKFGFKYIIGGSIIVSFAGLVMRLFASTYTQLYIAMMLMGLSSGILSANASKVIGSIFESKKVGIIVGYGITVSSATMVVSMATTAMMATKTAFIISTVYCALNIILWFTFIPSNKLLKTLNTVSEKAAAPEEKISAKECLKAVLNNKYVWYVSIGLFFVNGAMVGMNSMISAALVTRNMSETGAGAVSAFLLVGNLLGSLCSPTIAAKTGKLRLVLFVTSIIAALGTCFGWLVPQGILLDIVLLLTGYGVGSVLPQLLAINVTLPGVGPVYAGTAGGVTVMLELIGCIVIPTYFATPISTSAAGEINYYTYFILVGAGMLICALFMALLPKEVDVKA